MEDQLEMFSLPSESRESIQSHSSKSKPRLKSPIRNQIEFISSSIDDLIAEDHPVRNIWHYVDQMDITPILQKIKATETNPGRPATDPKIFLALWVYAISEGIGSARLIERYCIDHLAFRWLCGSVAVNAHSISDFRSHNCDEFDHLITETIARLLHKDLITLAQVSQDGMKVRAAAGTSSFRRNVTLDELYHVASKQVRILRKEIDADPAVCLNRQIAAKKRVTESRANRIKQAIEELKKLTKEKEESKKKHRKQLTEEERNEIRASTTDPEARKMKMSNGGFNPAYNMQIVIDTNSRFIVSAKALNKNNDYGQLSEMLDQVKDKYNKIPQRWLVDQGYLDNGDIIYAGMNGCDVYVNPKEKRKSNSTYNKTEHEELSKWRARMDLETAQEVYKDRASNSEWANAGLRNRGFRQLLVRGLKNVQSFLNLQVMTHNVLRAIHLGYAW